MDQRRPAHIVLHNINILFSVLYILSNKWLIDWL